MCRQKKSSFLGSPRDVFGRPSAAPEPMAPKFLHTTFPSRYFVLAEFHPPRLSFGGVMPPTPFSHRYNTAGHKNKKNVTTVHRNVENIISNEESYINCVSACHSMYVVCSFRCQCTVCRVEFYSRITGDNSESESQYRVSLNG